MDPGQFRVSDADRDQVAEVLHAAYAEGRISLDEHAERTSAALEARTFDALALLTADLVPAEPRPALSLVRDSGEPERITALLTESKRKGALPVDRSLQVTVALGSALLDLTEATFTTREVDISCTQFMGSITIRVRPGTTVRVEAANVLGDSSVKGVGEPSNAEPTIVVRGTNILGEITVRGPKKASMWSRHVA
jgi:FtsP/CotA-like multicopper oxidase with cupredoxin domain